MTLQTADVSIALNLILARLDNMDAQIKSLSNQKPVKGKTWLKPGEFAQICGVTPKTLRDWVEQGRFREKSHRTIKTGTTYFRQFHIEHALEDVS